MKTQITPIVAPRGGLNYSLPADLISDMEMSGGQNVYFEDGLIHTRDGYTSVYGAYGTGAYGVGAYGTSEFGYAILGMYEFRDFSGNSWLFIITEKNIYRADGANEEWDTFGGGTYGLGAYGGGVYGGGLFAEGTDEDLFDYTTVRDEAVSDLWFVCTNGLDPIKVFKGAGESYFENLLSSDPTGILAKYVESFKDYLVLGNTTESDAYPQRVRWSDTADPDDFTNGNASYKDLDGPEKIMGLVKIRGDYLCVLREHSLYVGWASGDSDVFNFERRVEKIGCVAPYTALNVNDVCVFLGNDGIYQFDGTAAEEISPQISNEVMSTINPAKIESSHSFLNLDRKEYWLLVPTTGDYPTTAWVWHWDLNTWSKFLFNEGITRICAWSQQADITIDDLIGTIDEQNWKIDDRSSLQYTPSILLGTENGGVFEYSAMASTDNGVAIDSYFDTKDFTFTNIMSRVRINRADISYYGTEMNVYYSVNEGVSWRLIKLAGESPSFGRKQLSFRTCADKIRFRFRSDSAAGHYQFNRLNIFWQPSGRI